MLVVGRPSSLVRATRCHARTGSRMSVLCRHAACALRGRSHSHHSHHKKASCRQLPSNNRLNKPTIAQCREATSRCCHGDCLSKDVECVSGYPPTRITVVRSLRSDLPHRPALRDPRSRFGLAAPTAHARRRRQGARLTHIGHRVPSKTDKPELKGSDLRHEKVAAARKWR